MERYELDEWDTGQYGQIYYARQKFNRRVKPNKPEAAKWYAVYPEGKKKGQKMAKWDPTAGCVIYAHKTSKLAQKVELQDTVKILSEVPVSLELIPAQFEQAKVDFWTPELTEKLKVAANAVQEAVKMIEDGLNPPKKKVKKEVKQAA